MDAETPTSEAIDPTWRKDASGWVRYRGNGRRGRPKTVDIDRKDLDYAAEAVLAAEDRLLELARRHVEVREALAALDLAARFIAEVRGRCSDSRDAKDPARQAAAKRHGRIAKVETELKALRAGETAI